MVRALAWGIRGREFESHLNHFPQNQIIIIFYFLVFPFYFSPFWSKTMCKYVLKVWQYWICNGKKRPNFFIFQNGKYPTQGQNKTHCVVIKLSIQGTMLLSRWRWTCTWWQILYKREKERFVILATFWKNDNSSFFWYTNSFNWKSNFVRIYYKSEDGYPNFLFSCLLLIALYTYSIYIIWLKKYSVVFYFLNF